MPRSTRNPPSSPPRPTDNEETSDRWMRTVSPGSVSARSAVVATSADAGGTHHPASSLPLYEMAEDIARSVRAAVAGEVRGLKEEIGHLRRRLEAGEGRRNLDGGDGDRGEAMVKKEKSAAGTREEARPDVIMLDESSGDDDSVAPAPDVPRCGGDGFGSVGSGRDARSAVPASFDDHEVDALLPSRKASGGPGKVEVVDEVGGGIAHSKDDDDDDNDKLDLSMAEFTFAAGADFAFPMSDEDECTEEDNSGEEHGEEECESDGDAHKDDARKQHALSAPSRTADETEHFPRDRGDRSRLIKTEDTKTESPNAVRGNHNTEHQGPTSEGRGRRRQIKIEAKETDSPEVVRDGHNSEHREPTRKGNTGRRSIGTEETKLGQSSNRGGRCKVLVTVVDDVRTRNEIPSDSDGTDNDADDDDSVRGGKDTLSKVIDRDWACCNLITVVDGVRKRRREVLSSGDETTTDENDSTKPPCSPTQRMKQRQGEAHPAARQRNRKRGAAPEWPCERCTYSNKGARRTCEMCQSPKPKGVADTTGGDAGSPPPMMMSSSTAVASSSESSVGGDGGGRGRDEGQLGKPSRTKRPHEDPDEAAHSVAAASSAPPHPNSDRGDDNEADEAEREVFDAVPNDVKELFGDLCWVPWIQKKLSRALLTAKDDQHVHCAALIVNPLDLPCGSEARDLWFDRSRKAMQHLEDPTSYPFVDFPILVYYYSETDPRKAFSVLKNRRQYVSYERGLANGYDKPPKLMKKIQEGTRPTQKEWMHLRGIERSAKDYRRDKAKRGSEMFFGKSRKEDGRLRRQQRQIRPGSPARKFFGRGRCGECSECLKEDCGECIMCRDMVKFGGKAIRRQRCMRRQKCLLQRGGTKGSAQAKVAPPVPPAPPAPPPSAQAKVAPPVPPAPPAPPPSSSQDAEDKDEEVEWDDDDDQFEADLRLAIRMSKREQEVRAAEDKEGIARSATMVDDNGGTGAGGHLPPPPRTVEGVSVGSRIEVYWSDDDKYYPCTVERFASRHEPGKDDGWRAYIVYDDNVHEVLDLRKEKFRLCKGGQRGLGSADGSAPRKKVGRRCGRCAECLKKDCLECRYCHNMTKYGGPGTLRQRCVLRGKCLGKGGLAAVTTQGVEEASRDQRHEGEIASKVVSIGMPPSSHERNREGTGKDDDSSRKQGPAGFVAQLAIRDEPCIKDAPKTLSGQETGEKAAYHNLEPIEPQLGVELRFPGEEKFYPADEDYIFYSYCWGDEGGQCVVEYTKSHWKGKRVKATWRTIQKRPSVPPNRFLDESSAEVRQVKSPVVRPTGFQALELCSGSGNLSIALREKGFDCTTLDHDPSLEADLVMSIKEALDHLENEKHALNPLLDVTLDTIWCAPECKTWSHASGNLYRTAGAIRGLKDSVGYMEAKEAEDDIRRLIKICLYYRERNENLIITFENPDAHLKKHKALMKEFKNTLNLEMVRFSFCLFGDEGNPAPRKHTLLWTNSKDILSNFRTWNKEKRQFSYRHLCTPDFPCPHTTGDGRNHLFSVQEIQDRCAAYPKNFVNFIAQLLFAEVKEIRARQSASSL